MKRNVEKAGKQGICRFVCFAVAVFALLTVAQLPATAETNAMGMPEGYTELPSLLPEGAEELLPDGIDSEDPQEAGDALARLTSPEELLRLVIRMTGIEIGGALRLLAKLCGLLMLAAVFSAIGKSIGSSALAETARFCTTTVIFAAIIHTQSEHLQGVVAYFERLSSLMSAMIPMMGTVWAMGGNVSTASAGTGTLYVFLSACEILCAKAVMPLCCFLTALALCNALSPQIGMRGLSGAVKKTYTFSMGMTMTVLLASLSTQTTLTAAADSVTARAAKTVSGTMIPMVGGSVGETLRTVAAGVQYLKSVIGVGGIVFLLLLTLPTLAGLVLTRLAFLLSVGVAEMLGCDGEGRLLGELGPVWGCMIAAVAMSSVMFILALTIFVRVTVAVM